MVAPSSVPCEGRLITPLPSAVSPCVIGPVLVTFRTEPDPSTVIESALPVSTRLPVETLPSIVSPAFAAVRLSRFVVRVPARTTRPAVSSVAVVPGPLTVNAVPLAGPSIVTVLPTPGATPDGLVPVVRSIQSVGVLHSPLLAPIQRNLSDDDCGGMTISNVRRWTSAPSEPHVQCRTFRARGTSRTAHPVSR